MDSFSVFYMADCLLDQFCDWDCWKLYGSVRYIKKEGDEDRYKCTSPEPRRCRCVVFVNRNSQRILLDRLLALGEFYV